MKGLAVCLAWFLMVLGCGGGGGSSDTLADAQEEVGQDIRLDMPAGDEAHGGDTVADEGQKGEDVEFSDLLPDKTPPKVVKTEPADGAINVAVPFVVKVTFSEAIRFKETVDKNTFKVMDYSGNRVPGSYQYDDKTFTVTFTPDANAQLQLAAPYRVELSTIIQDKAGNGLEGKYMFRFSTAPPKGTDKYHDLAVQYSPIVYQGTRPEAPQLDYLTSFDFDGNLDASDNVEDIKKATQVPSYVYYDVVETKSHYFIRYVYFHPYRFGNQGQGAYSNDAVGAMVVVKKYPEPHPIAVEVYFPAEPFEEVRSYVTKESGIVGDKNPEYYGVNKVFPESQLFPGGHYQAYLSASTHESCLWIHTAKEHSLDMRCLLSDAEKKALKAIQYVYDDGTPQALQKANGVFPREAGNVSFGLKGILTEWWARRDLVGDGLMYATTFKYEAPEGRPGQGMEIPANFVNTLDPSSEYMGRPPWGWKWNPASFPGYDYYFYDLPRGTFFLDPAYYFAERHRIEIDYDSKTQTGYSVDYCFNWYLLLDNRTLDPDCK